MADYVIETKDLTKEYDGTLAVDGLNLRVREGHVFGMLGPNGSGKTTTILMLLGLTEPTSGQVRVLGVDPARRPLSVKARVGYLPDQVGFYDELSAWENLIYIAKLNGIPRKEAYRRIDEALERMGLSQVANHRVRTFSRGMRQRLGVAEILIKRPRLVILDEPTQGLDPQAAREFLDIVRGLREEGISVLLASHLLYQVQAVCDRVGLFSQGKMVLEGSVRELAQRVLGAGYRVRVTSDGPAEKLLESLHRVPDVQEVKQVDTHSYELVARRDVRPEAAQAVVEAGGRLFALALEEPNLEEIYARYFREVNHEPASVAA
jgi:ABC-type multidrug transport system, ATPase component